jgi:hypothetical protein
MRKRRVGVTARSRRIVGNQATGTPQIATEIAAPLVSRTPMSTVAAATECGWKRGDTTGVKTIGQDFQDDHEMGKQRDRKPAGRQRADARMRRCLILRQGERPPETPGPLSLGCQHMGGRTTVKGTLGRQTLPPLTDVLPPEEKTSSYEGKGAQGPGGAPASRWSALRCHKIRRSIA